MKLSLKIASIALLVGLVFLPTRAASASGGVFDGQVIFGQSFTLKSGETLSGDLLVFGGSADIQAGATVDGNVVLFGGELNVDGEVTGDVAVTGATVILGPAAHIGGDLITVGASLDRAETSRVDGQIFNTATSWSDGNNTEQPVEPVIPEPQVTIPKTTWNFNPFSYVWDVIGNSVFLGLLAMLLMLFLAQQTGRVADAAVHQTLISGGLGLLTVIVVPFAVLLLVITIILIPVAIIVAVALAVAVLFGWIAIGYEIGQRLTSAFHWQWHPAFSAGLGTFLLTLVTNSARVLNFIPGMQCLTWVFPTLIGLFALGAVIMTRFGTQSVAPAPVSSVPVAPEAVLPPVPPEEPKPGRKAK
jgi:hypothetical protein